MDRRTLTTVVIAGLAILALGIAAATLSSTVSPSDEDGGSGGGGIPISEETETTDEENTSTVLQRLLLAFALLLLLVAVAYLVMYRREEALVVAKVALGLVGIWLLIQLLPLDPPAFVDCPFGDAVGLDGESGGGAGGGGDGGITGEVDPPSTLLVAGVVTVVFFAVLGVLRRTRADSSAQESDGTVQTEHDAEAARLAQIAGRAADRIEGDDSSEDVAENEIYRAWSEMTASLDVEDAETTTPREFQREAVDAGMTPDDVRELTRLFEVVRYGGKAPTETREHRAVNVLRRIEAKYGESE